MADVEKNHNINVFVGFKTPNPSNVGKTCYGRKQIPSCIGKPQLKRV